MVHQSVTRLKRIKQIATQLRNRKNVDEDKIILNISATYGLARRTARDYFEIAMIMKEE